MSHKWVSTVPAVYNAQTQASSILTITPQQTSFNDNAGYGVPGMGSSNHTVKIYGNVWSNYGLVNQQSIDRINYNLTDVQWDEFVAGETITSSGSYDQVVESALLYIAENIGAAYGLSPASWSMELD